MQPSIAICNNFGDGTFMVGIGVEGYWYYNRFEKEYSNFLSNKKSIFLFVFLLLFFSSNINNTNFRNLIIYNLHLTIIRLLGRQTHRSQPIFNSSKRLTIINNEESIKSRSLQENQITALDCLTIFGENLAYVCDVFFLLVAPDLGTH